MGLLSHWYKFSEIFPAAPAKRRGISLLTHQDRVIHGAITRSKEGAQSFMDQGITIEDKNSAYEVLSQRYRAKGMAVIHRDNLLKILLDLQLVPSEEQQPEDLYQSQLSTIRRNLGIYQSRKSKHIEYKGECSIQQIFPREHFLIQFFRSWVADLLPEKRLLLFGICNEEQMSFESILLEFNGRKLIRAFVPDWGSFDWRTATKGFIQREDAARFVQYCESAYILPTYSFFLSRRVLEESQRIQATEGSKAAWKVLEKYRKGGSLSQEVLLEPEPWPIFCAFYWHVLRGN